MVHAAFNHSLFASYPKQKQAFYLFQLLIVSHPNPPQIMKPPLNQFARLSSFQGFAIFTRAFLSMFSLFTRTFCLWFLSPSNKARACIQLLLLYTGLVTFHRNKDWCFLTSSFITEHKLVCYILLWIVQRSLNVEIRDTLDVPTWMH